MKTIEEIVNRIEEILKDESNINGILFSAEEVKIVLDALKKTTD